MNEIVRYTWVAFLLLLLLLQAGGWVVELSVHSTQFSKLLLTWKIYNDVTEEEEKTEQSAKPTTGGNNEQTKLTNQPTNQPSCSLPPYYIHSTIHPSMAHGCLTHNPRKVGTAEGTTRSWRKTWKPADTNSQKTIDARNDGIAWIVGC